MIYHTIYNTIHEYCVCVCTCEHHQAEAPLGVADGAASQQNLVVVQRHHLVVQVQRPLELVQPVVGRLAAHLA